MEPVPRQDFGSFSSYRSEKDRSTFPGDTASVRSVVGSCGRTSVTLEVRLAGTCCKLAGTRSADPLIYLTQNMATRADRGHA